MSSPAEPDVDARADDAPTPGNATDAQDYPSPEGALVAALARAQAAFPPIERRHTATVPAKNGKSGYSYSYADLADVLNAVRPVLANEGLALVQRTTRLDNSGKVLLVTELKHVAGAVEVSEVELGQSSGNPQAFGGALTYLRRYELVTLLGIAAEEDRDAQDVPVAGRAPSAEVPAWAQPATAERKRELVDALEPIIGRNRAKSLGASVAESFGQMPDGIVGFAKALVTHYALEGPGDVDERHRALYAATRQRNEEAAAAAEAQAERAAADAGQAAAEDPDAPAPDIPADVEPESAEDPPPDDLELVAQAAGDDRPPAGSIDTAGELPDDLVDAARTGDPAAIADVDERLRALGCVCKNPAAVELELGDVPARGISDECALKGHGIPF